MNNTFDSFSHTNREECSIVALLMASNEIADTNNDIRSVTSEAMDEDSITPRDNETALQGQNNGINNSFSSTSSASFTNMSCQCVKSRCLQLYCECFHSGNVCNDQCRCKDCGNLEEDSEERLAKMAQVLKRNKNAFDEGENKFVKRRRKQKVGCSCTSSQCLKKYCSCYFNSVGCSDKCNCTQCKNSYGIRVNPKKKRAGVVHNKLLNPDIQLAVDRLNESPQRYGNGGTTVIEHYPYAVAMAPAEADDTRAATLQKQANLNSARANLLLVKQMLLSAKYKQWDLEYSYGQFQDSGVSTAHLESMMKAVREALQSATDLTKEVKSMELEIAMNYDIYSPR